MTAKNLARRLERLEERHAVVNNVPEFVIAAVNGDGHIAGRYRLTPTGLQASIAGRGALRAETPRGKMKTIAKRLRRPNRPAERERHERD